MAAPPDAAPDLPTIRLAVGLGDAEREQRLFPTLNDGHGFAIAARCLTGDELLEAVRRGQADAILVAGDLHRLSGDAGLALGESGVPIVVLAPVGAEARLAGLGAVLPLTAEPEAVRAALLAALAGTDLSVRDGDQERLEPEDELPLPAQVTAEAVSVLTIAGGHGSPGRTTVAINLAAALGAVDSTVLVDADMSSPAAVIQLDVDPTRNLYMLAHAEPETVRDWDRAIEQETQPLARGTRAVLLCGVPKPEMRRAISSAFFDRLVGELRARYRYVVLDTGPDVLGSDVGLHRRALGLADHSLLVTATDLPGLSRTRALLRFIRDDLGMDAERLALILNRYDHHHHHGRAEIEWALGIGTAAVIPYDYQRAQHAVAAQRPLVLERRGRAAHALLELAGRVHGGKIRLAPEPDRGDRRLRVRLARLARARPPRPRWPGRKGTPDGDQGRAAG